MKKLTLYCLLSALSALVLAGCSQAPAAYSEEILGTWVTLEWNHAPVETDAAVVWTFAADGKAVHAGRQPTEKGFEWTQEPPCNYRLKGSLLYEDGVDRNGNRFARKSRIRLHGPFLQVEPLAYKIAGESQTLPPVFVMKRAVADYQQALLGLWKGRRMTASEGDYGQDTYWEYFPDGTYKYSYYDPENEIYIQKADNAGVYAIYGDFLATTFDNDRLTRSTGRMCECWKISIDGDWMRWTGRRKGREIVTFVMHRMDTIR